MTLKEVDANKHYMTSFKFPKIASEHNSETKNFLLEKGWLSNDKEVSELLKDGYKQFRVNTAERIARDYHGKIYFNTCPICDKLARTPQAKQCRYCGHSWHKQVVAAFQIASVFELADRQLFFIIGDTLDGSIRTGMRADLTVLGLATKPIIKTIEFFIHKDDDFMWEDMGLGLICLSEEDKEFLKMESSFLTPIPIEDENANRQ